MRGGHQTRARAVAALAAVSVVASAAGASAAPPVTHPVARPAAKVADYWTARRMRQAKPADIVAGRHGRLRRTSARRTAIGPAARSAVDSSAISGSFPGLAHGKVFFTIPGGDDAGDFVCSGTIVRSGSHTTVLTAGHCVDDSQFGGGFATNWTFVPGYHNGQAPFGTWPASRLATTAAWSGGADVREDLGIGVVQRDGEGRGIQDVLGARPIQFEAARAQQFTAFGYPAEATLFEPSFDGQRLYRCDPGVVGTDNPGGDGPPTLQIDCDMSAGASGGGWVNATGAVNGITSYGYAGDFTHLYGPYFGSEARAFFDRASGPSLACQGREVTNLGTSGPDDYSGTEGRDAFRLAAGADRAAGGRDKDTACGGGGADRLSGGPGADALIGSGGDDVLRGGPGRDLCIGGPGHDRAVGCERRRGIP